MLMRMAFMGTPPFAAHILKVLLEKGYQMSAVYTQPPRPVGRGYKITPSPVQELAESYHIPVFFPSSLKTPDVQAEWRALDLDVAIVAAYGLILPKAVLEGPKLGCVNVHPSLLPRWRGATPIQSSLLAGDSETGVTLIKMDEGLDTGDMLWVEKMPLDNTTTTPLLSETLAEIGAQALIKAIPQYAEGKLLAVPQPAEGVTCSAKLTKGDGELNWALHADVLERKVRALNPWPGTWFRVGPDIIKVLEAIALPDNSSKPPGTLVDNHLTIACGQGALRLLRVQKTGKASLSPEDFLRGYKLPACLKYEAI